MKDKILQLLGAGHSNAIVAAAVGCSESYVSQLLSDEEFARSVTELKIGNLQANTERDNRYDQLEDELITKLKDSIPMLYKPLEIVRVAKFVNEAKRRGASNDTGSQVPNTFVKLNMPTFVQQNFILNERNEVVEVAGRSMQSIDAKSLIANLTPKEKVDAALNNTTSVINAHRAPPMRVISTPPNLEVTKNEQPVPTDSRERANA